MTQYGMSERFGLVQIESVEDQYLNGRTVMNCSDKTAADVDTEVQRILAAAYEEAKKLLSENRELMDELAEFLLEKESITGKEFMEIFNRAKGIEPEEETGESSEGTEGEADPRQEKNEEQKTDGIDVTV